MNFLQFGMLAALPLAALPVIIHLIHQQRHRTVKWAAMMFLLDAKKLNHGLDRLRQILILAMRVLAVLGLILAVSRPLVSGWLGFALGGRADTTLVLLDRSASMEETDAASGVSKREAAVGKIVDLLQKSGRSARIILIDSARIEPVEVERPADLLDIPEVEPTATQANIPALVQAALDYLQAQQVGNANVWICSDLQASNWRPESGHWESLREAALEFSGVRWRLLAFPGASGDNLAVRVHNIRSRRLAGGKGRELLIDLELEQSGEGRVSFPLATIVNGVRAVTDVEMEGSHKLIRGHSIPMARDRVEGWGRVELPADRNLMDNQAWFAFGQPMPLRSVVVAESEQLAGPALAALRARANPLAVYETSHLEPGRVSEIDWSATLLLVWQVPIPAADSLEARQLENFVRSGRTIFFFPPRGDEAGGKLFGTSWQSWQEVDSGADSIGWWRTDAGLLANTQAGEVLPWGGLEVRRLRPSEGTGQVLARMGDSTPVVVQAETERGSAYFCGLLPEPESSSLATDGVAFFVMLHRALAHAAERGAAVQHWDTDADALSGGDWTMLEGAAGRLGSEQPLVPGVFRDGERFRALNRPAAEDDPERLSGVLVTELMEGTDFALVEDRAGNGKSLASEVWRTFVFLMGLALLVEAILCLPAPPASASLKSGVAS